MDFCWGRRRSLAARVVSICLWWFLLQPRACRTVRREGRTQAGIPIQLTSIAALLDMPVDVYVFSDARVVPKSYLHVEVNDLAVNWTTGGSNYDDVITRAADEAGGQAFATGFAGDSTIVGGQIWWADRYDTAALLQYTDPVESMAELIG